MNKSTSRSEDDRVDPRTGQSAGTWVVVKSPFAQSPPNREPCGGFDTLSYTPASSLLALSLAHLYDTTSTSIFFLHLLPPSRDINQPHTFTRHQPLANRQATKFHSLHMRISGFASEVIAKNTGNRHDKSTFLYLSIGECFISQNF